MFHNESLFLERLSESSVVIMQQGKLSSIGIAFGLSIVGTIGILIKILFIYYIKYKAPKDRPINRLMLFEQVRQLHALFLTD